MRYHFCAKPSTNLNHQIDIREFQTYVVEGFRSLVGGIYYPDYTIKILA